MQVEVVDFVLDAQEVPEVDDKVDPLVPEGMRRWSDNHHRSKSDASGCFG